MKYLIFGATGFIGSKLAESLIEEGHEVVNVSRQKGSNSNFMSLTYEQEEEIVDFLKISDGAIFSAGKRWNNKFGYKEYLSNVELIYKVIELLIKSNQKNCIFLSTIGVYGDYNSPWKEEDNNIPSNLYALSKKHQDDIIEFYNNSGMNFKILRLAQVMGLGERKGFLFNTFFDNAINNKELTIMGTGKGRRQYIYLKDVIAVVKKLLNSHEVKGIYNLGLQETTSIEELAYIMKENLNPNLVLNYRDYSNEDLSIRYMIIDKLIKELNFIPRFSVGEAIIDMKIDLEENN